MPLLIIPILWIAAAVGRQINRRVLGSAYASAGALERCLFGVGTGLVLAAYGILVIGVVGQLHPMPIVAWFVLLAILGAGEHVATARDLGGARRIRPTLFSALVIVFCAIFAIIAVLGCFTPPSPTEWDSLSYHLADPKIYLSHHRIIYLPWESHSNFAFTMEMLYTVGLMAHSIPLAKLFHFSMAVITALTLWQIGRRHLTPAIGALAALLYVAMPLIYWEAGTAYVDLAAACYGTLALLALLNAMSTRQSRWFGLCAVMLGCMVSIKATSLITTALYAIAAGIWVWRTHRPRSAARAAGTVAAIGVAAVLIGSPWYIKSWIVTGNPVYPFAYGIFGGHYWNAENAANYSASQANFGVGHMTPKVKPPLLTELLMIPYSLTMFTLPNHQPPGFVAGNSKSDNPFNDFGSTIYALSAFFLAALFIPAFRGKRSPDAIRVLGMLSLASLLIWFFMTQQERYLLPTVPLLCLFAVYYMDALWRERRVAGYALGALFASQVAFSLWFARQLAETEVPVAVGAMTLPHYLGTETGFESYSAIEFLNAQPPGSGVVCYGEPRGFYLNQPYMWGETGHSTYIPYAKLATPEDLRRYFVNHGIIFALVDERFFPEPPAPKPHWASLVYGMFQLPPVTPTYNDSHLGVVVFKLKP